MVSMIILSGSPNFIQVKKLTWIPKSLSKTEAMRMLGGEPTKVAIPPILAPYATDRSKNTEKRESDLSSMFFKTAIAIGNIMSEVAVLEIHMLNKPVLNKNPNKIRAFDVPTIWIIASAICVWTFHFSSASDKTNPPKNK